MVFLVALRGSRGQRRRGVVTALDMVVVALDVVALDMEEWETHHQAGLALVAVAGTGGRVPCLLPGSAFRLRRGFRVADPVCCAPAGLSRGLSAGPAVEPKSMV